MIPVILVTGFLGSGKTTFLKAFAQRHPEMNMVYLVNELADVSVDGRTLEATGLPIHSVVGGSLFCECKASDFIRIMNETVQGLHRDRKLDAVIVETSGIANPDAIGKMMLQHGLGVAFDVKKIVTIVSPRNFIKLLANLPVIESQITTSDTVILNKIDLAEVSQIAETRTRILSLHPSVELLEAEHCNVDITLSDTRHNLPMEDLAKCTANPFTTKILQPQTIFHAAELHRWLEQIPECVVRAKGNILTTSGWFNVEKTVDTLHVKREPSNKVKTPSEFVMIVHDDDEATLHTFLKTHPLL